uniref:Uncharacterized protein n=1 Tax=Romanomermis culicivorax TaxID=13658 RepID=A0A915J8U6_ROMCU
EYCNNTASANWFIVVDASWSNEYSLYEKTKVYYEEQKKIVDQIIEYISKVNGEIANSDDKHEISIILATDGKIDVIRNLCNSETEGRKLPPKVEPKTDGIPLGEILEEIDQQSTHCNWRPNRQRFVLLSFIERDDLAEGASTGEVS